MACVWTFGCPSFLLLTSTFLHSGWEKGEGQRNYQLDCDSTTKRLNLGASNWPHGQLGSWLGKAQNNNMYRNPRSEIIIIQKLSESDALYQESYVILCDVWMCVLSSYYRSASSGMRWFDSTKCKRMGRDEVWARWRSREYRVLCLYASYQ